MCVLLWERLTCRPTIAFRRAPGQTVERPELAQSYYSVQKSARSGASSCKAVLGAAEQLLPTPLARCATHRPTCRHRTTAAGAGTGVPARSRTADRLVASQPQPLTSTATTAPPHLSTHAPGSARQMAHAICGCSSRRHQRQHPPRYGPPRLCRLTFGCICCAICTR